MIAAGVYSSHRKPSGPPLEKMRKRIKPKTTVGKPIRVLRAVLINVLPRKSFMAINIESGVPQRIAKMTAYQLECLYYVAD